jgi:RNA polymerase sigma-70 factor (ECF subfamily)
MLHDFESIVREHGGRMLAVARRILQDEDAARDAVQDAFISAYRARNQFEGTAKLSTWLHRIVVNAALMRLRSRSRQREEPLETWLPAFEDTGHHAERFQSPAENPEESLAREETRRNVRAAIDSLPESYRVVLMLRDIDMLSTEETARMLGITPNAVKLRLHRARMALRAKLYGGATAAAS